MQIEIIPESASKLDRSLLVANLMGAVVYLLAASPSWAIPEERGMQSTTGEPFVWVLFVVPIFASFGLLNLFWATAMFWGKRWQSYRMLFAAAAVWLVAVCVDFAHH